MIDVPQKLKQSDAKPFPDSEFRVCFNLNNEILIFDQNIKEIKINREWGVNIQFLDLYFFMKSRRVTKEELIIK